MKANVLKAIAKDYCRAVLYGSVETGFADDENLLTVEEHEYLARQIEKIADRITSNGSVCNTLEEAVKRHIK